MIDAKQMDNFAAALSDHDARHNICIQCIRHKKRFITIINVDGVWKHNQKGYVADHEAEPASKIFAGSRELPPHEEIIVDEFLAPHRQEKRDGLDSHAVGSA